MLEKILTLHNLSVKAKITVKSLVSTAMIILAVALPQLVHLAAGAQGGAQWLPMYLPVILGGCLLGSVWGIGVGVLSPVVSYLITLAAGNPMPVLERLPFMIAELALMAAVSGLFTRKISSQGWMAFPAVILSFVAGRAFFMITALIFSPLTSFTPAVIWAQIQSGMLAVVLQSVIIPFIVMGLRLIIYRDKNE